MFLIWLFWVKMTQLSVFHANGKLMSYILIHNGKIYGTKYSRNTRMKTSIEKSCNSNNLSATSSWIKMKKLKNARKTSFFGYKNIDFTSDFIRIFVKILAISYQHIFVSLRNSGKWGLGKRHGRGSYSSVDYSEFEENSKNLRVSIHKNCNQV